MNYVIIVNDVIWKVTNNDGLVDVSMIQQDAAVGLGV
jgi:hypothetical protein